MTDLAEGYKVRAYVTNDNDEVAHYCEECADEIRSQYGGYYPLIIEEYEDSVHYVKDFYCESCGKEQEHECGKAVQL